MGLRLIFDEEVMALTSSVGLLIQFHRFLTVFALHQLAHACVVKKFLLLRLFNRASFNQLVALFQSFDRRSIKQKARSDSSFIDQSLGVVLAHSLLDFLAPYTTVVIVYIKHSTI